MNEISQLIAQYGPVLVFMNVPMDQLGLPTPTKTNLTMKAWRSSNLAIVGDDALRLTNDGAGPRQI